MYAYVHLYTCLYSSDALKMCVPVCMLEVISFIICCFLTRAREHKFNF